MRKSIPNYGLKIVAVIIIVVVAGYMILFGPGAFQAPITNQTYPENTENAVILATPQSVLFNASGPGPASSLIPFHVNATATLTGSWESSNISVLTVVPYTINKTKIQSYLSSIQDNVSAYDTQGSFNLQLQPGDYYLIVGPITNSSVRVIATTEIEAVYS